MNKLIVGCGYLGRRVAQSWVADGHRVTALTRSATRAEELARDGIHPIVGDVCRPETLTNLPDSDTVLFAVGYDRSSGYSQQQVYVEGLKNVLQAIVPRTGRLIYISSSSVYGQNCGEWVDETSECQPSQPGGECCLAAERFVESSSRSNSEFSDKAGFVTNVLRLSGIYGPGRLLSRVEALRAGEPLTGRADAWLNLIHVDDAVLAVRACDEFGQHRRTYLVSDDRPISRGEYYGLLATVAGAPPPTFNPDLAARRGSGGLNKRCRNERIRDELKFTPRYPTISEGVPQAFGRSCEPSLVPPASPTE